MKKSGLLASFADVLHRASNLVILRRCSLEDAKQILTDGLMERTAEQKSLFFLSLNVHMSDILVAVAVV